MMRADGIDSNRVRRDWILFNTNQTRARAVAHRYESICYQGKNEFSPDNKMINNFIRARDE